MARYSSKDIGIFLIGGYDLLSSKQTDVGIVKEAILETPSHGLGDTWQESADTGLRRAELTQDGYFDDAANRSHDAFNTGLGGSRVGMVGLEGNTQGKQYVGMAGDVEMTYRRVASRGALHRANAEYKVSGVVEEGRLIHTHAADTGGNGTAYDNGASSVSGGAGYLEATALTLGGYTSVTVKLQHSVDNVVFADLGAAFANVTAIPTAERVAYTGTINRYVRAVVTFNGAGSGQTITLAVGLVRA